MARFPIPYPCAYVGAFFQNHQELNLHPHKLKEGNPISNPYGANGYEALTLQGKKVPNKT